MKLEEQLKKFVGQQFKNLQVTQLNRKSWIAITSVNGTQQIQCIKQLCIY